MKKLIILLSCLNLTGCIFQSVSGTDLEDISAHCGGVEKVSYVDSYFLGNVTFRCQGMRKQNIVDILTKEK